MASNKSKPARTLTKHQQNISMMGVKKKKVVVKTTLENPYTHRLPDISEVLENEIISQVKSCCTDLKVPDFKPPWKTVCKLKREKRVQYCQEYKKDRLKQLQSDRDALTKYEVAKEARSHLIFGYNSVMRALEQNKLAGILVNKNVEPSILAQSFLPGCIHKCVPLVPILNLDSILRVEHLLGVKHSVMVLGFKPSVQESSCRFYPVLKSMMKTLEDFNDVPKAFEIKLQTESKCVTGDAKLSSEEILKRMEISVSDKESKGSIQENMEIVLSNGKENIGEKPENMEIILDNGKPESMELVVNDYKGEKPENIELIVDHVKGEKIAEKPENMELNDDGKVDSEQSIHHTKVKLFDGKENKCHAMEVNTLKYKLKPEEIGLYHLKRSKKSGRVFVPESKKTKILDLKEAAIEVAPPESVRVFKRSQNIVDTNTARREEEDKKETSETPSVDFQWGFFLDTAGNEKSQIAKEDNNDRNDEAKFVKGVGARHNKKNPNAINNEGIGKKKIKKGAKPSVTYPYVPAKTKRIKNNPNRESYKKKQ